MKLSGKLICRIALCLAALLGCAAPASAQLHPFSKLADTIFTSIGPDIGMPSGSVQAFAQDADGYIWIGTQGGLDRWDGTHMRVYMAGAAEGTLPGNLVLAIQRDRHGRLWIGTDSSGLARYDALTDRFIGVPLGGDTGANNVGTIIDDSKDGLWVGTGDGVFHIDAKIVDTASHVEKANGIARVALAGYQVQALLLDRNGIIWVGTTNGLFKVNPATGTREIVRLPSDTPPQEEDVTSLIEDSSGTIWAATSHDGAYHSAARQGEFVAAPLPRDKNGLPFAYGVFAMVEAAPGVIWVGTDGRGLLEINKDTNVIRSLHHDAWVKTSVINDTIRALFKDNEGRIWLGTDSGFSRYDPSQRAFVTMFGIADRQNGLSDPDISSVLGMPNGPLWVGTRYHGIEIVDAKTATVTPLWPDSQHLDRALPPFAINQMITLPGGTVLAVTGSGLYRLNGSGSRIERLTVPGTPATVIILTICYCHGSVWIGEKNGLWQLDVGSEGPVRVLRQEAGTRLTDPRVQTIYEGDGDDIWVGTVNGLNLVHANSSGIERIPPDRMNKTQMGSGEIENIVLDKQRRLWIGTLDEGLYLMSGAAGHRSFRHFSKTEGLPNDDVSALLVDNHGYIWFSTDQGLARMDPDSFAVRVFDESQGVAIETYWAGSGSRDSADNLFFGGLGGLTVVDPDLIENTAGTPPLVVTDVHIGGKPAWVGRPDATGAIAPIVLSPQENSLSVQFTLLDYSSADRDSFAYRLEGFDSDWVQNEATPRLATYTNLPPGQYVLKLRGAGRNGAWLADTLALPIIVLPNWYQTPWFRLAILIGGAVFVAGLVQIRTALLRQRQRELERVVAERTAELSLTQAQLRHFAYVDMLTGLPNRRAFTEEFRRLLDEAQSSRARLALLLIDMDGFKQVNDTLGHHAGDALLVAVGGRLRGAVREGDFVARLGGDEFAVLLMLEDDVVELVCHRIIDGFGPPIAIDGENIVAGASIGVAIFPDHGMTQERIYKMADVAMYAAKRDGRGTWRCFADTMETV